MPTGALQGQHRTPRKLQDPHCCDIVSTRSTWGYLEVPQTEQEATSTHKPRTKCPENISEAGYKCVCLNARSIVNKKNELSIIKSSLL